MNIIRFQEHFKRKGQNYLGTVKQGQDDFPKLDHLIRKSKESVILDIKGFDFFGYSYAKQTIRKILQMSQAGLYDSRFFLICAESKEYAEEVSAALSQLKLTAICGLSTDKKHFYDNYFIVGDFNDIQKITLDYIIKKKVVTSGEMQKDLMLESVQAASNRIRKLVDSKLVRWEASPKRQRNVLHCQRIEI